jgi:hypothetical protein
MPKNVVIFERLMYAAVTIGLLNLILDASRQSELPEIQAAGGFGVVALVALVALGLLLVLMWLIARKRKNWARWLFVGFFVIGLWPTLQNVAVVLEANPPVGLLSVAQIVVQMAAIFFIFSGDAGPWFEPARGA